MSPAAGYNEEKIGQGQQKSRREKKENGNMLSLKL